MFEHAFLAFEKKIITTFFAFGDVEIKNLDIIAIKFLYAVNKSVLSKQIRAKA